MKAIEAVVGGDEMQNNSRLFRFLLQNTYSKEKGFEFMMMVKVG